MNELFTRKGRQDAATATYDEPGPRRSTGRRFSAGGMYHRLENYLLNQLLRSVGNPPISIVLWDGREFLPADGQPRWRVSVADRRTLWKLVWDPLFEFGEAYSESRIDVEGDLSGMLTEIYGRMQSSNFVDNRLQRLLRLVRRPRSTSARQSRQNIFHHYDIGNEFYQRWLDDQMVYTCAYFAEPNMGLEQAQIAKMDLVCRKLRLQPGQTVYEAGCGWGSMAIHMAQHYRVRVKAVNISREQIQFARERCERLGLNRQVEFLLADWRELAGQCDVFVSIGMLEHVGVKHYRRLGQTIQRCLKPAGLGLIHTIGQNQPHPLSPWTERRIFPGAYPPALSEIAAIFEPNGFSVLDVENLRLHYAETLEHWAERYEHNADWVIGNMDERFSRMWRLYLLSSIAAFRSGNLQLFQVLFAHGNHHGIPRIRHDIYAADENSLLGAGSDRLGSSAHESSPASRLCQ